MVDEIKATNDENAGCGLISLRRANEDEGGGGDICHILIIEAIRR
jgi:hypothetical protein